MDGFSSSKKQGIFMGTAKKKKKEQSPGEGWDWKMKLLGQVRQN